MRVLFVCLGNICRSPTAEAVLRAEAPDWEVDSAGTGNWHIGKPPYAPMQDAARRAGYELSDLRARQVQESDFPRFDLVVGMDAQNVSDLERLRPHNNQTPLVSLAEFDGEAQEIPDPYFTRDFEAALQLIMRCVRRLKAQYSVRDS